MMDVSIRKQLPFFPLEVSFSCAEAEFLVLVGPSGAGKTTLVRILAGLEKPDAGRIVFDGVPWVDTERRLFVPPQRRRLGYVFQEYTLFPHLSLARNAAFAAADASEANALLARFGIAHLRDRRPDDVSGGERQRCALCQALARRPRLLLLDEPFSALDAFTRRSLREEIRRLKEERVCPIIYVTHDLTEALALADEVLPIVEGRIDPGWLDRSLQRGSPAAAEGRFVREPRLALAY